MEPGSTIFYKAQSGLRWMKEMYVHGLWWSRTCAERINAHGARFLKSYNFLAWLCLNKYDFPAFAMKPKLHMLGHTVFEVNQQLGKGNARILSCLIFNCEANEDLIGRVARLSRRVHQTRVCERVLEHYLIKCHALYQKYLKDPSPPRPKRPRNSPR